jgi:general secretion pathway protein D
MAVAIATMAIPSCTQPRSPEQLADITRNQTMAPTQLMPVDVIQNGRVASDDSEEQIPERIIRPGTGNVIGSVRIPGELPPADATDGISLNFVNADIGQVVKAVLGDILHKNYAIDPGVVGTVTFQTSAPLPKDAILPALEQVFHMSSVAVVRHGDMYIVEPAPQAAQTSDLIGTAQSGYGVEIVPLRYVSADDLQRLLTPISPPGAILKFDIARNLLVIGGSTQDRAAIVENVRVFDVDWMAGMSFGLFTLQSADAQTMANELSAISGGKGGPLDGIIRILPIQRLNAVLVISPQRKYVAEMGDWVQRLDKGQNATEPHLYVYYVKNGRATDLASVLNRILTGAAGDQQQASTESAPSMDSGFSTPGSSQGGGGSSSSPTGSGFGGTSGLGGSENGGSGGSPQSSLLNAVNPAGAETSSTSTTTTTTTGQGEEAGLRITADESTNSLLILATDRQYRTIESALSRLDIAPLQVMLEAAVAEVQLNNDLQYGLQYYFARGGTTQKQNQLELSGNGTSTTTALATFGGATAATLNGFGYAFNGANIQMVLKALADITKITVVSSPKLLVLNNETAQLLVGNQVPISTSSSTSTIAANAPTINQISYQSTGVILKVTPRVNEGGLVTMDVSQEVSSVAATAGSSTASEAASPTISDRRINTTVAVQDGETVALGGMIQDNKTTEHYGIPYIQNIPYLGNMFRSTTNDHDRTELLVLITPHIIQSVQRMRDITTDLRSEMAQTAPSLVGNQ